MRKRWWLFHATDFQSLMHPCFTFCRILGIFPYKISASTFKTSTPHYILTTVIICTCCGLDLIFIYDIAISKSLHFGGAIVNFEALGFYAFSCFIAIVTHILNGPRMRLLQSILESSSKLPSKSYEKLSRFIHVKDIFGTILMIVQLSIFFARIQMFELPYPYILIVLFTIYLEMLMFQMNMMYINCVCVLKTCFKRINDNLRQMQRFVVNDIQLSVHGLTRRRNKFLLIELKVLKKWHLTVSETVRMLNVIFNLQLLATIVMSFIEITFELYSYVVRWQGGVSISLDWKLFDALFTSMVYYFMKITLLAWACETTKNQAKEIGTTIHDIINSATNGQLKNEVVNDYLYIIIIIYIFF